MISLAPSEMTSPHSPASGKGPHGIRRITNTGLCATPPGNPIPAVLCWNRNMAKHKRPLPPGSTGKATWHRLATGLACAVPPWRGSPPAPVLLPLPRQPSGRCLWCGKGPPEEGTLVARDVQESNIIRMAPYRQGRYLSGGHPQETTGKTKRLAYHTASTPANTQAQNL
jgi:hypothetical protein